MPPVPVRAPQATPAVERPRLVFFYGRTSGPSRRVEGFLSQVLQRRHNHDTFKLIRVCAETNPELIERFAVGTVPTIVVVVGRRVRARVEAPRGRAEIEQALGPWLR